MNYLKHYKNVCWNCKKYFPGIMKMSADRYKFLSRNVNLSADVGFKGNQNFFDKIIPLIHSQNFSALVLSYLQTIKMIFTEFSEKSSKMLHCSWSKHDLTSTTLLTDWAFFRTQRHFPSVRRRVWEIRPPKIYFL